MYQIIYTSYKKTEQGLVLINNWIEAVLDDNYMLELIQKYNLPNDFKYPGKHSISNIIEGEMDNLIIHIRIVKF
jgi:hypothetical protein